ncbi:hypothetical protein T02_5318 [Trichinella nativa]|uniref:Uncharacterized protein n=1 Tax=Trichinella nativa TaxID=6335 RepID=A0A0V1LU55_9BILA|nr:hypothetical protein T02_5318 [Trichinella nativa]KRZ88160.1 hypothetical protein T08_6432 [Trichinella sp. T8]
MVKRDSNIFPMNFKSVDTYCQRAVIDKQKISEFCSTFLWSPYFSLSFDLIDNICFTVPNSE